MIQANLFDDTIETRFRKFHRENPHVYRVLVALLLQAQAAGRKRVGMRALFERARWDLWLTTKGEPFKLNNNFAPRYARLIETNEPHLQGMLELRRLRTP